MDLGIGSVILATENIIYADEFLCASLLFVHIVAVEHARKLLAREPWDKKGLLNYIFIAIFLVLYFYPG